MAKICIAVPSGDTWKAGFGLDLAGLIGVFTKTHPEHSVAVVSAQISILAKGRMHLVQEALKRNATHILFLDSDARFSTDTLSRLLAHDLDFVACNAVRRSFPCTPTTRNAPGKIVWTMPDDFGLEEVFDHVGLHTALVKTSVFNLITKPWFAIPYLTEMEDYQGEDVWFCHKLLGAGVKIYIDHDLSHSNRHTGSFDFTHQLAALGRAEYEKEAAAVEAMKRQAEKAGGADLTPSGVKEYDSL